VLILAIQLLTLVRQVRADAARRRASEAARVQLRTGAGRDRLRARLAARGIATAALILGLASTASAQPHPCDEAIPLTVEVARNASVRIGFCHPGVDQAGAAVTDFQIVLGTGAPLSIGIPTIVGAPSPSGLNYYETAVFTATAGGTFSILAVAPGGTSLPSTPVTLTIASLPDPPTGVRIVR
jgi:hypothetical protein